MSELHQVRRLVPHPVAKILTLAESSAASPSIRAKALVFQDPESQQLLAHVERLARSDATVLVTGETGTGKERIARHIHTVSGRPGPFVAVNCGAFSETLIDAELFGHESGAFTGASQARAGWFEAAQGGTLFLDEVGDLPLPLQVKLLRVLQERQVVRLGSRRPIPLDVRLVAATNIDLARAVAAQHFRADLYYRLSVACVRLPALHQRPSDIVPLAEHFIGLYRSRLGLAPVRLSPDAAAALQAYHWPGNIRELENVIHYALIVCLDGVIGHGDLNLVPLTGLQPLLAAGPAGAHHPGQAASAAPASPGAAAFPSQAGASAPAVPAAQEPPPPPPDPWAQLADQYRALFDGPSDGLFDRIESTLVHVAFAHCQANQVRTARQLGITRNVLRTLLKRHGLLGPGDGLEGGDAVDAVAEAGDVDAPGHAVDPVAGLPAAASVWAG